MTIPMSGGPLARRRHVQKAIAPSAGIPLTVAALAFRGVRHFGYPVADLNSRVFHPDVSRLPDANNSVRNRGRADSK